MTEPAGKCDPGERLPISDDANEGINMTPLDGEEGTIPAAKKLTGKFIVMESPKLRGVTIENPTVTAKDEEYGIRSDADI